MREDVVLQVADGDSVRSTISGDELAELSRSTKPYRRQRWIARCRALLVFASLLVPAGLCISWWVAGALIAPAGCAIGPPPLHLPAIEIQIDAPSTSKTAAWHIRSDRSRGVIILAHGIRGSRLSMIDRAEFLYRAGYSILAIDLQAHGESPGTEVTIGYHESKNISAAVQYAKQSHPNEPVAILGVSLGGAAALMASPLDIDALILESVFPTVEAAIHNRVHAKLGVFSYIPAELLLLQLEPRLGISRQQLRPIDAIGDVQCPIFVISGKADPHTTDEETLQLFERARDAKLWLIDGAAHVDLHEFTQTDYEQRILNFLEESLQPDISD